MTTVAQAYLHLAPFDFHSVDMGEAGYTLSKHAGEAARAVFPIDVRVDVEFQEGSLISRTRAVTIAAGFLNAVIWYGDIKAGLQEITNNAKVFSASVIDFAKEVVEAPPASEQNVEPKRRDDSIEL